MLFRSDAGDAKPPNIYTARFFTQRPGPSRRFLKIYVTRLLQGLNCYIHIKDITNAQQQIKDALDSNRELGETESMRLQMAMDRLSKLLQTLSNIVKIIGDAQVAIVQNIK